jgi:O-antigen/teichoic acid export membrane protein
VALALFARLYGLEALGLALLVWAYVEVVSRLAGLGLDRGLQRFVPASAAEERPRVAAAALAMAFAASLPATAILAAVLPQVLGAAVRGADVTAVRLAVGFLLPVATVAVTALHAVRGTKQILALVWARSVVEPVGFLLAGLALAAMSRGPAALLAAYGVSIAAVAAVAIAALSRSFGLGALAAALRRPRALPLWPLLRFSVPLGIADVVNLALQRGDVLAVGAVTGSPAMTAAYAVAREVVSSLSKIRQGFDQVLAPVAAELHAGARRRELAEAAAVAARWGAVLAAPLAIVFVVYPEPVLAIFGVSGVVSGGAAMSGSPDAARAAEGAAAALAVLAIGRLVDTATGPTSILLAMVGRPMLVLFDAAVGLGVALLGAVLLGPRYGLTGVAAATSAGLVTVNLLALSWLDRLERLHPVGAGLARPALAAAIAGAALALLRLAVGVPAPLPFALLLAVWAAAYLSLVGGLGLLPASWNPFRRTPLEVT